MNFDTLRTWAEVDLGAIEQNFVAVRNHLPKNMKLLVTVKADAYGHGALTVVKQLEGKADYFALAAMDEAAALRQAGIPIAGGRHREWLRPVAALLRWCKRCRCAWPYR